MSELLITHPGKLGDAVWAMATVRAIAAQHGKVDVMTSPHCNVLAPLLKQQPYIHRVIVDMDWAITDSCPGLQPRTPTVEPQGWKKVVHLGMKEWPEPNLFSYYPTLAAAQGFSVQPIPDEPWLFLDGDTKRNLPSIAFSDEWAELKAGLVHALAKAFPEIWFRLLLMPGCRLASEWDWKFSHVMPVECDVLELARLISASRFLVSCKALPYVLATAMGVPVVVIEPGPVRQQAVFDAPPGRNIVYNSFDAREAAWHIREMMRRTA